MTLWTNDFSHDVISAASVSSLDFLKLFTANLTEYTKFFFLRGIFISENVKTHENQIVLFAIYLIALPVLAVQ